MDASFPKSRIFCIGEAWGEREESERTPFVGPSGYELTRMLTEAGINRADCFLTNVFNLRPPGNKIEALCGPRIDRLLGYPALVKGKYVRAEFAPELGRLADELRDENPNLVIALGNTPTWALTGETGISKLRGTTLRSTHTVIGLKILPTYHPAAVLRQWDLRPVTVMDLAKARREAEFPEIRRPRRQIWIEPTLEDLETFYECHIIGCPMLSVDIETAGTQVTCIGFAPSASLALVVPFLDTRKARKSYWDSQSAERRAWAFVRRVLEGPTPKVFQNGLYDISFLWRGYGIKTMNAREDTMLLHHALQPESEKSLRFLGSVYTDEGAWKSMRAKHTIKQDD